MKQNSWQQVSIKGVNFENLLIDCVAKGFINWNKKKKIFGPFYATGYRQMDANRYLYKKEVYTFITKSKKQESNKSGSILKSYLMFEEMLNELIKLANSLQKIDFNKYDNEKLAGFLVKYFEISGSAIVFGYNYYFYQYLGEELLIILDKKKVKNKNNYFEIFTQAKNLSVMQESQIELLSFVQKIKKQRIKIDSIVVKSWINKHLKKYAYMGFYWYRGKEWQYNDVKQRVILWSKDDYQKELKKLTTLKRDNKIWKKLAKQLGLTKEEIIKIATIKQMAYCTNNFDESFSFLTQQSQPLLRLLTIKLGVTYNQLIEMSVDEVINGILSGKKVTRSFIKILKFRINDSCYLLENGKYDILVGEELADYRSKQVDDKITIKKKNILHGQSASPGTVVGKVVIIKSVSEISKVKKGDILVAKCTVPAFLPAMEKAGGFITETGGILSHAAIVAREIKKPCIIGVDHVMEIFKDGDNIQVDATRGVVKKI